MVEGREKNVPLHSMYIWKLFRQFSLWSILRSPDDIKGQIPQNVIFLRKCDIISETTIGRSVREKLVRALTTLSLVLRIGTTCIFQYSRIFQNNTFSEMSGCSGLMRFFGSWRVQRYHFIKFDVGFRGCAKRIVLIPDLAVSHSYMVIHHASIANQMAVFFSEGFFHYNR